MVPWNFVLLWKNYDTMDKSRVLWKKNYVTILRAMIYEHKKY